MNEHEQRITIAEACGWTQIRESKLIATGWIGLPPGKDPDERGRIPDYLNDLNAMHEAEKMLISNGNGPAYRIELSEVAWQHREELGYAVAIVHAPAALRAEAFLRTIGKWPKKAFRGQPS